MIENSFVFFLIYLFVHLFIRLFIYSFVFFVIPEQQFFESLAYKYTVFSLSIFVAFSMVFLLTIAILRTGKDLDDLFPRS